MKMKHYISSENCEKEIKEILCVPEKENMLVQMGMSIIKKNKINRFLSGCK
jgi:hypothetical protein